MKEEYYQKFCEKIVSLDNSIRFAGISDADGSLLGVSERKGLKPLLTPEQRAQYAITAATRQYTRLRWEYLLGKIQYASSHYAKLIRATIPITDNNNNFSNNDIKQNNTKAITAAAIIIRGITKFVSIPKNPPPLSLSSALAS